MTSHTKTLVKFLAGTSIALGASALYYARYIETKNFKFRKLRVDLAHRHNGAAIPKQRLKILHISDLHLHEPEAEKIDFLRSISDNDYDLVALTGDIFENYSGLPYISQILSAKPKLGAFAVLGNHDYYNYSIFNKTLGRVFRKWRHPKAARDVRPMIEALETSGFKVMQNSCLNYPQKNLHIVGIDYPSTNQLTLNKLVEQKDEYNLVLALFHVPMNLANFSQAGIDFAMGGHTHGGQVHMPGFGPIITDSELPRHEASGLFQRGKTIFHVSRGLGADPKSNIRFFCPPQAEEIELIY
jgi:predicted MPP superfamily phosphohydrolase